MFTLHPNGAPDGAGRSIADAQPHELHQDRHPAGPLDGELLDLYAAILIVVPLALFMKAVLF
jgi:hypothetical protein